jgi:competence protein ComEA
MLASSVLVLLAAVGRLLLTPPPPPLEASGLGSVGAVDSVLAVAESLAAESERRRQPLAGEERIDPNKAAETELDRLPGVGPTLARAIVASRQRDGPFRSLGDLERVPGIGSTTVSRLAPHLALGGTSGGRPGTETERSQKVTAGGGGEIDLNSAPGAELETLPGIGPVRAAALLRWREDHGPFRTWDELLAVPGIGPATVERLRPLARLGS